MYTTHKLVVDAVPDITNVQVQINTKASGFIPLEAEQRITYLIETAMAEHTSLITLVRFRVMDFRKLPLFLTKAPIFTGRASKYQSAFEVFAQALPSQY
ncbi:efflux RND transporter permease subunit [Pseudoalteromonas sp. B193]